VSQSGRQFGYESHEEELLLLVADFAGKLAEVPAQPFRLRFWTDHGRVEHTPDFLGAEVPGVVAGSGVTSSCRVSYSRSSPGRCSFAQAVGTDWYSLSRL
jgi:hypothetical protein